MIEEDENKEADDAFEENLFKECKICDKFYDSNKKFRQHEKKVHGDHDPQEALFKCPECSALFVKEKTFELHMATHKINNAILDSTATFTDITTVFKGSVSNDKLVLWNALKTTVYYYQKPHEIILLFVNKDMSHVQFC